MTEQLNQELTKKVTFLPDGRRLIYYNFFSEAGPVTSPPPVTPPSEKGEGE
ncbi:MAG: hypothetical protein PVH64_02350 [Bacillota bacterium]|jgi:hypothetical protein